MLQKNQEVRRAAAGAGVYLWQIAEKLGVTDANFSRLLRKELDPETRERVLQIIAELERAGKEEAKDK